MRKLYLFNKVFLFILLGIPFTASAQFSYFFQAVSGTYTPISGPITSITPDVGWGTAPFLDDGLYHSIPIGFTFTYAGNNYTTMSASTNGWACLGYDVTTTDVTRGQTYINDLDGSPAIMLPIIAPLWDDMDMDAGSAEYITTGTVPNRVFTLQWSDVEWLWSTGTVAISFQMRLYETTGVIEFQYLPITPPSNPSASIGMTNTTTGSGNFISLDGSGASPNASYTVETTTISAQPASGQIYRFTPVADDLATLALIDPNTNGCHGATETVTVQIRNTGTNIADFSVNNTTVNVNVTGAAVYNLSEMITTGTLAAGATMNHTFGTTIDMTASGTYTFNANVVYPPDGNPANDAMASLDIIENNGTLPQAMDFTGFTGANLDVIYPGWAEGTGAAQPSGTTSDWTSASASQSTAFGFNTSRINLDGTAENDWMYSPVLIPGASDVLRFSSALTEQDGPNAYFGGSNAMAGTDDQVRVMISTDCGTVFNTLFTLDGTTGLSENFSQFTVSLAPYAGQQIVLGFLAQDGPVLNAVDYDIHIADVFIGTPPALDLSPTDIISPAVGTCYSNMQQVTVEVSNFGTDPINFAANGATVTVNVSGAGAGVLTATLNTGTLPSGSTMNVNVMPLLDMSGAGTYNFDASVSMAGDGFTANDVLPTQSVTADPNVALPQTVDFVGYNGGNLPTLFTGWYEAFGDPISNTSFASWIASSAPQTTAFGFTTARVGLFGTNRNEWIVSPKFIPTAADGLYYYAATTEFGQPQADGNGSNAMVGTDDRVRVMISTDCGNSFTTFFTMDQSTGLSENFTYFSFNLAPYAGSEIILAFLAQDGPVDDIPSYDFHLSDVYIGPDWVLPVEWLDFYGITRANSHELYWQTGSELNSAYFAIERSVDGQTYEEIGQQTAAGQSQSLSQYQFTDSDAPVGKAFYRIRQVDQDGRYAYSSVIELTLNPAPEVRVFPNPIKEEIQLNISGFEGAALFELYDAAGRRLIVAENLIYHGMTWQISAANLPEGVYVYRLITGGNLLSGKIQKMNE